MNRKIMDHWNYHNHYSAVFSLSLVSARCVAPISAQKMRIREIDMLKHFIKPLLQYKSYLEIIIMTDVSKIKAQYHLEFDFQINRRNCLNRKT